MKIDFELCTSCGECIDYCPADAIVETNENNHIAVIIVEEKCVECGVCRRVAVCPVEAIIESDNAESFPSKVQALFSDPNTTHKITMVPGRGTEESKTNDVTGRYKRGEIGCCIELGRPGICCTFRDISLVSRRLIEDRFQLEKNNPITNLMNTETGEFSLDLMNRRILSAILEVKIHASRLEEFVKLVKKIDAEIDTVFSVGFICRFDEDGGLSICEKLIDLGVFPASNAKINIGVGTPPCSSDD